MKKLIIIPTYNERENIGGLIKEIQKLTIPNIEILVVDDSSPDGTAEHVSTLFINNINNSQVHLLLRTTKEGLGKAYIAGFQWALARQYDLIIQMDADFSHHPRYLHSLLKSIDGGADLVLGSRYVSGGGTKNWGLTRKIISRGGSLYARLLLGLKIRDLTGGFKCFRSHVLEKILMNNEISAISYSFQIEMTYHAHLLGFTIQEIPIIFEDRTAGISKMNSKTILEAMQLVLKLRQKSRKQLTDA